MLRDFCPSHIRFFALESIVLAVCLGFGEGDIAAIGGGVSKCVVKLASPVLVKMLLS